MTRSNAELARTFADAFNRHDVPAIQALVTHDFELTPLRAAVERVTYHGPAGVAEWVRDLDETWSEISIEFDDVRDVRPGRVLVIGRVVARGHGSSVPVESEAGWVALVRDGLLTSVHTYLDPAAARAAAEAE